MAAPPSRIIHQVSLGAQLAYAIVKHDVWQHHPHASASMCASTYFLLHV